MSHYASHTSHNRSISHSDEQFYSRLGLPVEEILLLFEKIWLTFEEIFWDLFIHPTLHISQGDAQFHSTVRLPQTSVPFISTFTGERIHYKSKGKKNFWKHSDFAFLSHFNIRRMMAPPPEEGGLRQIWLIIGQSAQLPSWNSTGNKKKRKHTVKQTLPSTSFL